MRLLGPLLRLPVRLLHTAPRKAHHLTPRTSRWHVSQNVGQVHHLERFSRPFSSAEQPLPGRMADLACGEGDDCAWYQILLPPASCALPATASVIEQLLARARITGRMLTPVAARTSRLAIKNSLCRSYQSETMRPMKGFEMGTGSKPFLIGPGETKHFCMCREVPSPTLHPLPVHTSLLLYSRYRS